jgi:integrase
MHNRKEYQEQCKLAVRKATRIYEDNFEHSPFDYKVFCKHYDEKEQVEEVQEMRVAEFCLQVSEEFKSKGQAGSSDDYRMLASSILKVSPKDLRFSDFTKDWLEQFEKYFLSRGTNGHTKMIRLKALYGKAVQKRLADHMRNPFRNRYTNPYGYDFSHLKKLKISRANTDRIKDLTLEQLQALKDYKPKSKKEAEYIDMWWLSYYMFGVNMIDLCQLKRSDVKNGRWHYQRSKTGHGLKQGKPILPEAMEILERRSTGKKYLLSILDGYDDGDSMAVSRRARDYAGFITKACKRISKSLGFDGYFTYYSARHTSATMALNMGADRNTVSHLLDHANLSTLDNYAGRANDENIVKAMELLRV